MSAFALAFQHPQAKSFLFGTLKKIAIVLPLVVSFFIGLIGLPRQGYCV
jgi:hypothetical protein